MFYVLQKCKSLFGMVSLYITSTTRLLHKDPPPAHFCNCCPKQSQQLLSNRFSPDSVKMALIRAFVKQVKTSQTSRPGRLSINTDEEHPKQKNGGGSSKTSTKKGDFIFAAFFLFQVIAPCACDCHIRSDFYAETLNQQSTINMTTLCRESW